MGLGSFRVNDDGEATLKLPLPVDPKAFTYFDLSLEPAHRPHLPLRPLRRLEPAVSPDGIEDPIRTG